MPLTILTTVRIGDDDAPGPFSRWTHSGSGRGGGDIIVNDHHSNFAIGEHFPSCGMCCCVDCLHHILPRELITKLGLLGWKLGLSGWKLGL